MQSFKEQQGEIRKPSSAIKAKKQRKTTEKKKEYWSGLPFPSLGDLPDPGIEPESPMSPVLPAGSLPAEPSGKHQMAEDKVKNRSK